MQVVSARRLNRLVAEGILALFAASFFIPVVLAPEVRAQDIASKFETRNSKIENRDTAPPLVASRRLSQTYARLPLSFEPNRGQAAKPVQFVSRGKGYTLFLAGNEAMLDLSSRRSSAVSRQARVRDHGSVLSGWPEDSTDNGPRTTDSILRMRLVGANHRASVQGTDILPGKANYFIGNDPNEWRTGIPTYARVRYVSVYPGVDLVYYGNQGQLEYDFVVAPGADPRAIRLALESAGSGLRLASNGDLIAQLPAGEVRFQKPTIYQPSLASSPASTSTSHSAGRAPIGGRFRLTGRNQVSFELGSYDHTRPLVIDPTLTYSTYLGGSGDDTAGGIAVDSNGDVYVTGATTGINGTTDNFPLTPAPGTPFQNANAGGHDVFVSEINSAGTALIYSTYIGGSGDDYGAAIALDSLGAAYITGNTNSTNFPATSGAFQSTNAGSTKTPVTIDAFVVKLSPGGSFLAYSTYLGGEEDDFGTGIAVNSGGNACLTGYTDSIKFPTAHAAQPTYIATTDAFFTEMSSDGTSLMYSTYVGGGGSSLSDGTRANGIALDASGKAYIVGQTTASSLVVSGTAYQTTIKGGVDAFVAEYDPTQTRTASLIFATYLGGSRNDYGYGIALDASENIYVAGGTASSDFPVTTGAFQGALQGTQDAFVTKLTAGGSTLSYSTYLGGTKGVSSAAAIAVDASGNALVTGNTQAGGGSSPTGNFPTVSALQTACGSGVPITSQAPDCSDAFVASLNTGGTSLNYSTYLGGGQADAGVGIALDPPTSNPQSAYIVGSTASADFPTTPKPLQASCGGTCAGNLFVAKIEPVVPSFEVVPVVLPFGAVATSMTSLAQTVTVTNNTGSAVSFTQPPTPSAGFVVSPTGTTCSTTAALANAASCTVAVTFNPTATGVQTGTLTLTDSAPGGSQVIDLAGTGVASVVSLTPSSLTFSGESVGAQSAPQNVTLNNVGAGPLTVSSITVSGAGFAETNTCGSSVAAGGTCTISVTFTPATSATTSGVVSVNDNATGSPQTVSLTGSGASPGASLSTSTLNFGSQVVNTRSSTPQAVVVTNTGNSSLSMNSVTVSGPNATEFTLLAKAPCGSSIAAGSSCSIQLNFKPAAAGTRSATLSVADSAPGSPQTVALAGMGADFSVAATPSSASVNPGGSTTFTTTLAPIGGFTGTVTVSCVNPASPSWFGSCNPSSGSVTLNGTSSSQMMFKVTTLAPAAAPRGFGRFLPPGTPFKLPWACGVLAAIVSLLVLTRARRPRALVLLAATLILATFWMSCSGGPASGNQNNPANNGTEPGTYTITITGAAQGLGNSTTVSVVVN